MGSEQWGREDTLGQLSSLALGSFLKGALISKQSRGGRTNRSPAARGQVETTASHIGMNSFVKNRHIFVKVAKYTESNSSHGATGAKLMGL